MTISEYEAFDLSTSKGQAMLRYMISPIVGDGTENDPFRAKVQDLPNVNSSVIIPTHTSGPDLGKPKYRFAFCLVATSSISAISAVTNAFVLPDYPLDGRMDGMDGDARTGMVQSVEAYDMDGAGLHLVADNVDDESYREVLTRIGQQIEPVFNLLQLNVGEVAS